MKIKSTRFGFTLAEVLITLSIIGVVAGMTIPTLMNNVQDKQFKVAYKSAYALLAQSLMAATTDNKLESPAGPYDPGHWHNFMNIMSYLKQQRTCYDYETIGYSANNAECWAAGGETWNSGAVRGDGWPNQYDFAAVDISGMEWALAARGYGAIYLVDTNGHKKPNQMGKDRFLFGLENDQGDNNSGVPVRINVVDNEYYICHLNKCETQNNYYGLSWLQ